MHVRHWSVLLISMRDLYKIQTFHLMFAVQNWRIIVNLFFFLGSWCLAHQAIDRYLPMHSSLNVVYVEICRMPITFYFSVFWHQNFYSIVWPLQDKSEHQLVSDKTKRNYLRRTANVFKLPAHVAHEACLLCQFTSETNRRKTNNSFAFVDTIHIN